MCPQNEVIDLPQGIVMTNVASFQYVSSQTCEGIQTKLVCLIIYDYVALTFDLKDCHFYIMTTYQIIPNEDDVLIQLCKEHFELKQVI